MTTLQELQQEIESLKERNRRVEADKAWETSLARKILILALTYSVIVIFFLTAGLPNPFINAIVPALGYFLSTLTIPAFKKWWVQQNKQK